jgi:hypothetical protein
MMHGYITHLSNYIPVTRRRALSARGFAQIEVKRDLHLEKSWDENGRGQSRPTERESVKYQCQH